MAAERTTEKTDVDDGNDAESRGCDDDGNGAEGMTDDPSDESGSTPTPGN